MRKLTQIGGGLDPPELQPIGETPVHFDEESTNVYGVGAFLLAGHELYRLVGGTRAAPPAS